MDRGGDGIRSFSGSVQHKSPEISAAGCLGNQCEIGAAQFEEGLNQIRDQLLNGDRLSWFNTLRSKDEQR